MVFMQVEVCFAEFIPHRQIEAFPPVVSGAHFFENRITRGEWFKRIDRSLREEFSELLGKLSFVGSDIEDCLRLQVSQAEKIALGQKSACFYLVSGPPQHVVAERRKTGLQRIGSVQSGLDQMPT